MLAVGASGVDLSCGGGGVVVAAVAAAAADGVPSQPTLGTHAACDGAPFAGVSVAGLQVGVAVGGLIVAFGGSEKIDVAVLDVRLFVGHGLSSGLGGG